MPDPLRTRPGLGHNGVSQRRPRPTPLPSLRRAAPFSLSLPSPDLDVEEFVRAPRPDVSTWLSMPNGPPFLLASFPPERDYFRQLPAPLSFPLALGLGDQSDQHLAARDINAEMHASNGNVSPNQKARRNQRAVQHQEKNPGSKAEHRPTRTTHQPGRSGPRAHDSGRFRGMSARDMADQFSDDEDFEVSGAKEREGPEQEPANIPSPPPFPVPFEADKEDLLAHALACHTIYHQSFSNYFDPLDLALAPAPRLFFATFDAATEYGLAKNANRFDFNLAGPSTPDAWGGLPQHWRTGERWTCYGRQPLPAVGKLLFAPSFPATEEVSVTVNVPVLDSDGKPTGETEEEQRLITIPTAPPFPRYFPFSSTWPRLEDPTPECGVRKPLPPHFRSRNSFEHLAKHVWVGNWTSARNHSASRERALEVEGQMRGCPCKECGGLHPDTRRKAVYVGDKPATRSQVSEILKLVTYLELLLPTRRSYFLNLVFGVFRIVKRLFFKHSPPPKAEIYSYDTPLSRKHQDPRVDVRPNQYQNSEITAHGSTGTIRVSALTVTNPLEEFNRLRPTEGFFGALAKVGAAPYHRGAILNKDTSTASFEHTALKEMGCSRVSPISAILDPRELASRMERYANSASHINVNHSDFLLQSTTLVASLEATRFLNQKLITAGHERGFQVAPSTH